MDETWALAATESTDTNVRAFAGGPFAPLGCEEVSAPDARELGLGTARWLVRIGGNATLVAAARGAIRALGDAHEVDVRTWDAIRERGAPAARSTRWRWDSLSSRLRERFDPARVLNRGLLGEFA